MPAPDPHGITIEAQGPCWGLLVETFMLSGRAKRILANLRRDGWACQACGGPVPAYRRADMRYCFGGCRKRSARIRRELRGICYNLYE